MKNARSHTRVPVEMMERNPRMREQVSVRQHFAYLSGPILIFFVLLVAVYMYLVVRSVVNASLVSTVEKEISDLIVANKSLETRMVILQQSITKEHALQDGFMIAAEDGRLFLGSDGEGLAFERR